MYFGTLYSKVIMPSDWKNNLKTYSSHEVIFEGDMILPRSIVERVVEKGSIKSPNRTTEDDATVETGAMTAPLNRRWKDGVVPYVIDKRLKCTGFMCKLLRQNPEKHIRRAMAAWSKDTCIKFREKTPSDRDYIRFVKSKRGHCATYVGRWGFEQKVYLGSGCRSDGIIMHELGHVLGLYHEQSRPDR